ncbi:SsrA-binding protein SmpB [Patescibacteria group bacterium]|nr:SsrA-binding protein SmpB [Patescibacteria group bacterium]MCL5410173.1 SsrA-binding protein SmpB [Patescibacteria group bacterium]
MRIVNRQAWHNYHILESLEAGIQLYGFEVKSIRAGRIDLSQASVRILNNQVYLINANIPRYQNYSGQGYEPTRSRRLLLHKTQIQSLIGKLSAKNMMLLPVAMYDKNNLIKIQLGLGKSKKEFDKRKALKEKDHQRRIEQELRGKE